MLRDQIQQNYTYLNSKSVLIQSNISGGEQNSTMLRLCTMTNEIQSKYKTQMPSTIKWREEKEKLLRKLTSVSPNQKKSHVRQPTLSDSKHDNHQPKSPSGKTLNNTGALELQPFCQSVRSKIKNIASKSVPRPIQKYQKENTWDVDGMIKTYMVKKQSQTTFTDPDDQDNLKQRMSKIYAILEPKNRSEGGRSVQNKVSQLRMTMNKVFLKGLNNQFSQQSLRANKVQGSLQSSANKNQHQQIIEERRNHRVQLKNVVVRSSLFQHQNQLPPQQDNTDNQLKNENIEIFKLYSSSKKKQSISNGIDVSLSPTRLSIINQPLHSECVEFNENQFSVDHEIPTRISVVNFKSFQEQLNLNVYEENVLNQKTFSEINLQEIQITPDTPGQLVSTQQFQQLSSFEAVEINMVHSTFEQWIKERESKDKKLLIDEVHIKNQNIYEPLRLTENLVFPSTMKTNHNKKFGNWIIKDQNITKACQILSKKLEAWEKLILIKSFSHLKEKVNMFKRSLEKQCAIKDLFALIKMKICQQLAIVIAIVNEHNSQTLAQNIQVSCEMSLSFDDISKIQQPIFLQQNDTLFSNIFQRNHNPQCSRSSSQIELNQNYLQEVSEVVKIESLDHKKESILQTKLQLQRSGVHQYAISKNDHTPVKTEIFLYSTQDGKASIKKSFQQSESKRDNSSVNLKTNLSQFESRSRYQSQYSQAKIEPKSNLRLPQKDVKQMLAEISSPVKLNYNDEPKERILANLNYNYKVLESPEPRFMHQRENNNMSPIAEPKELAIEGLSTHHSSVNVFSKQVLIQNSFNNFLKGRQHIGQKQSITPSKHQFTQSHQQLPIQSSRGKNGGLSNNINLVNQQEVTNTYQLTNNQLNPQYYQQPSDYITNQKAKIAKKFQSINRQNSGCNRIR